MEWTIYHIELAIKWGADLREADLRGADLRRADLRESDLRGANLCEADLREAQLPFYEIGPLMVNRSSHRSRNLRRQHRLATQRHIGLCAERRHAREARLP